MSETLADYSGTIQTSSTNIYKNHVRQETQWYVGVLSGPGRVADSDYGNRFSGMGDSTLGLACGSRSFQRHTYLSEAQAWCQWRFSGEALTCIS